MKHFIASFFLTLLGITSSAVALTLPTPKATYEISGGQNLKIAVQEWGNSDGPTLLFSHAWSMSHLGWLPQISSDLAKDFRIITYDLRGHGNSEKPTEDHFYNNADGWADDLNAILTQLDLNDVTLIGWSYSSVAIADYIHKYGEDRLKALAFVGGLSGLGVERVYPYFGTAFDPMLATSSKMEEESLGMVGANAMMVPDNLDRDTFGLMVAASMATPKHVRLAMISRKIDHKTTYETISLPVLLIHGAKDNSVLPIAAEDATRFLKKASLSIFPKANHGPHWTDPKRFNQELSDFVKQN